MAGMINWTLQDIQDKGEQGGFAGSKGEKWKKEWCLQ